MPTKVLSLYSQQLGRLQRESWETTLEFYLIDRRRQMTAESSKLVEENAKAANKIGTLMWINHLSLLPGDPSVTISFNAISSGVGSGLSGLIIGSTTKGESAQNGGNKIVQAALQVPPLFLIRGVRVCYELSNSRSFISQIRLAQVQDPPRSASVILDDGTNHTNVGPICVNTQPTSINPTLGAVLLSLRVNFGDTSDKIIVRGIGLRLSSIST